jgi:hypothetical protein
MGLIELLQERSPPIAAVQSAGRYLLRGQHSRTGREVNEGFFDLLSVVARASDLISAGYAIDIRSAGQSPTSAGRG